MLLRFDPFRDLDRLANEMLSSTRTPQAMPMDVFRSGDHFVLHFDLPGIDADSMSVTAENNTLTVTAERRGTEAQDAAYVVAERPRGRFSRQLVLGEGLDLDRIDAGYTDGVLTLRIPVAEQAKPRRIEVTRSESDEQRAIGGSGKTGERKVLSGSTTG